MRRWIWCVGQILAQACRHPVAYLKRLLALRECFRLPRQLVRKVCEMQPEELFRKEWEFVRSRGFGLWMPFPYARVKPSIATVEVGESEGYPFVLHRNRRLFFRAGTEKWKVERWYRAFIEEEGITGSGILEKHPHNYQSADHVVEQGDVLLDIGCSEALFTLDNIDKVSAACVFEADEAWRIPLERTFAGEKKVSIVMKFVGDRTEGNCVKVTDVVAGNPDATYFVKMDIEGGERIVLESLREFFKTHKVKLSCCTYHRQDDAEVIERMLREMGFSVEYSEGYMLVLMNGMQYPYFRKGVIYARNYPR